MKRAGRSANG